MSRFRSTLALAAALIIGSSAGAVPGDYGESIQPLLADHCYACHGPDEKARKAGLRFDQRDSALAELKSGARAIVPGEIATSEVIRRIFSDDPDEVMPPPKFKKRPSEEAMGRSTNSTGHLNRCGNRHFLR
jgi:mono/diheme cytochrome c family protein